MTTSLSLSLLLQFSQQPQQSYKQDNDIQINLGTSKNIVINIKFKSLSSNNQLRVIDQIAPIYPDSKATSNHIDKFKWQKDAQKQHSNETHQPNEQHPPQSGPIALGIDCINRQPKGNSKGHNSSQDNDVTHPSISVQSYSGGNHIALAEGKDPQEDEASWILSRS